MRRTAPAGTRHEGTAGQLREPSDPEFFAHWAAVRSRLALTSTASPEHPEIRSLYDDVAAEYRRRMHRAPAETA